MNTEADLANYLAERAAALSDGAQFWLGIAGAPGSGKSTLSRLLLERLGDAAIVVPMDGYHFYRSELDAMADPEEAHKRRGAPFTFNAARFVRELSSVRGTGKGQFPSFDHGVGDPVERNIEVMRAHRVVIVEGNYLLLEDEPWCQLRPLFDETWFLGVDIEICKERVRRRFLATGRDEETARFRVDYNDGPNGELVARVSPRRADRVISLPERGPHHPP